MISGGYVSIKTVPEKTERRVHVLFDDNERLCDIIGNGSNPLLEFKKPGKKPRSIRVSEFLDLLNKLNRP